MDRQTMRAAASVEEGEMDVAAALVADGEATELGEPR